MLIHTDFSPSRGDIVSVWMLRIRNSVQAIGYVLKSQLSAKEDYTMRCSGKLLYPLVCSLRMLAREGNESKR